MGDYRPANPFEIPLVVELVTKYSSPTALLPCRQVNYLWNSFATKKLTADGWTVNIRSAEQLFEYLRLTRATQDTGSTLPPMNFHVSAVGSTDNIADYILHESVIELNNKMTNAAATANMRQTDGYSGIQSLTCDLQTSGITGDLQNLLQLVSPTITEITLFFTNPEPGRLEPPAPVAADFNFPRLRSMCLDFSIPEWALVSLDERRHQFAAVKVIMMSSPNLEHIRSSHRQANSPIFMIPLVGFEREAGLRAKLQQLTEMDVTREEVCNILREVQFSHLRVLKISSYDYDDFRSAVHKLFHERWRKCLRLFSMVRDRCPALESLEITERHGANVLSSETSNQLDVRLPQLAHFAYRQRLLPETRWINQAPILSDQASALFMADLMNRFENLTAVSTDLQACIALAEVYRTTNEYLFPPGNYCAEVFPHPPLAPILRPQSNGVTKLTLDVAHASVPMPTSPFANARNQDVVRLVRAMFPSLDTLVINLGADRVADDENRIGNFGFVLGLAFQVDTTCRIEVNNYYNGWALLERPTPTSPSSDSNPSTSTSSTPEVNAYDNAAVAFEAPGRPSLEILVIRGVRPSFVNSHIEINDNSTPFSPPHLDLVRLCEFIPAAIKPGLVLEIDGDLLMNCGLHDSYIQLQEEMNAMTEPRIRLM